MFNIYSMPVGVVTEPTVTQNLTRASMVLATGLSAAELVVSTYRGMVTNQAELIIRKYTCERSPILVLTQVTVQQL